MTAQGRPGPQGANQGRRSAAEVARELAGSAVEAESAKGTRELLLPIGVVAATVVLAWQAATQWGTVETELASLRGLVEAKHELQTVQVGHLRDTLAELKSDVEEVASELRTTKAGRAAVETRLDRVEADLSRLLERVDALREGR